MIVLVDVDHTLSDASWRDALIGGPWDTYHEAACQDKCLNDLAQLIRALHSTSVRIVGVTSRPEKWRKRTIEWMIEQKIMLDEILMRPDDNYEKSPDLKVALVSERFGPDWRKHILCIIDDRQDVIERFAEEGVTGLLVHNGCKGEKS